MSDRDSVGIDGSAWVFIMLGVLGMEKSISSINKAEWRQVYWAKRAAIAAERSGR